MKKYLNSISYLYLFSARRNKKSCKCPKVNLKQCLQLIGSLNRTDHGVLSQAAFAENYLREEIGNLTVLNLLTANRVFQKTMNLKRKTLLFSDKRLDNFLCHAIFDASKDSFFY